MGHTLNTKHFINPGDKRNRVTIIEEATPVFDKQNRKRKRVKCKCDCGKEFTTFFESFYSGKLISCGCYQKEMVSKAAIKRGDPLRKHHLHIKWRHMIARCNDKNNKKYGGRGIDVCVLWRNSYEAFYTWSLSNGYSPELEIDRRINSGNYCPSNCRWVTREVNANNKRNNVFVLLNGEKMGLRQACKRMGRLSDYKSIHHRVRKYGFSFEDAISIPLKRGRLKR